MRYLLEGILITVMWVFIGTTHAPSLAVLAAIGITFILIIIAADTVVEIKDEVKS